MLTKVSALVNNYKKLCQSAESFDNSILWFENQFNLKWSAYRL